MRIFCFYYDASGLAIAAKTKTDAYNQMAEIWTPVVRDGEYYIDFGPNMPEEFRYEIITCNEVTEPGVIMRFSH